MTYHGYQMPPTGPAIDGLDLVSDGASVRGGERASSDVDGGG